MTAPSSAVFATEIEKRLSAGIDSGELCHLHAVLIAHAGKTIVEKYYLGPDENWGKPLGQVNHGTSTLHDIRSVTKSVVSLLYGIALDRGLVPKVDESLIMQFPEYGDLCSDPARQKLTIEHALTMTLGLYWNENAPYTSLENSEIAMEFAQDRYRFVLEQEVVSEPGEKWTYSGGCVALVGYLIKCGTSKSLDEFAREALLEPLGITDYEWVKGPKDGVPSAASGLRLKAQDLIKIGKLCQNKGEWEGRQIISRTWIEESLKPVVPTGNGMDYGRLWWSGEASVPGRDGKQRWYAGFGNGGQLLWLLPDSDIVVVILSGNYNAPDMGATPARVWQEIVLPSLQHI